MSIYTRLHETGTMDEMMSCPYNPSHVMAASRFQIHIVKCRKANPEKAQYFEVCPYNGIHHVHKEDFNKHLTVCPQYHHFQRSLIQNIQLKKEREEAKKSGTTEVDEDGAELMNINGPVENDDTYSKEWE